ncbi:MAG: hypothetical protein HYV27_02230 [Candidatus Hydrogenedentes bacterium]|nr:hypothetical protein [Candidatus Hydrogenedentota bacterium]
MIRACLPIALSVAIVATAMAAPFVRPVVEGDLNGDSAVNVLDIQQAVARLTTEEHAPRHCGVDPLGLQRMIKKAQTGTDEAPEDLPQREDVAYVGARVEVAAARDSFFAHKTLEQVLGTPAARQTVDMDFSPIYPRTERYCFNLTANAPPHQA